MFVQAEPKIITMIVRTGRVRRGDVIAEQVPDQDNPYREVTITEHPEYGKIHYDGHWVPVKYLTGVDNRTGRKIKYTGVEYGTWQIIRSTGR